MKKYPHNLPKTTKGNEFDIVMTHKPDHPDNAHFKKYHDYFMPNVPLSDIAFQYGKDLYLYDYDGEQYLDFAAGIAVASLGHTHPLIRQALSDQAYKVISVTGAYMTEPRAKCAELLIENSCMDQVFFCNSGTESIEAALKLVRKWSFETKGEDAKDIIVFNNSFHGRTIGAASLSAKRSNQPEFAPYPGNVHEAIFNDIGSVKDLISDTTAAIFVEPVQGEGGIYPADSDFLKDLRALCDDKNIALVFDEIQSGIGRLGTLFAYQSFKVEPDIICLAKGLGSGMPIGALLARKEFSNHFTPGSHGSTYGSNPLATHVARTVLQVISDPEFLKNINYQGDYLLTGLERLRQEVPCITDLRGMGLMIGIEVNCDIKKALEKLRDNGLLATQAGKNTIRLTPPLVIEQGHADQAIKILEKTLHEFS